MNRLKFFLDSYAALEGSKMFIELSAKPDPGSTMPWGFLVLKRRSVLTSQLLTTFTLVKTPYVCSSGQKKVIYFDSISWTNLINTRPVHRF